jgi:cytochrome c oxidase cbb3-type subunit III
VLLLVVHCAGRLTLSKGYSFTVKIYSGEHTITRNRPTLKVLAQLLLTVPALIVHGQLRDSESQTRSAGAASAGQRAFAVRCAGCHGLDGQGGERGPNIAANAKAAALSDSQLVSVISSGRPTSGMPAFRLLGTVQIQKLVAHLRVLQGKSKAQPLAGDSQRGKVIFFGKADCASCHMAAGQGGFLGSDLSTYAYGRSPKAIREAIAGPDTSGTRSRLAEATTREGKTLKGLVRNEDNFSVQLQSEDGSFHFYLKSELEKLEYQTQPLMPTNYGDRLSQQELDDLVGYLQSIAVPEPSHRKREED